MLRKSMRMFAVGVVIVSCLAIVSDANAFGHRRRRGCGDCGHAGYAGPCGYAAPCGYGGQGPVYGGKYGGYGFVPAGYAYSYAPPVVVYRYAPAYEGFGSAYYAPAITEYDRTIINQGNAPSVVERAGPSTSRPALAPLQDPGAEVIRGPAGRALAEAASGEIAP